MTVPGCLPGCSENDYLNGNIIPFFFFSFYSFHYYVSHSPSAELSTKYFSWLLSCFFVFFLFLFFFLILFCFLFKHCYASEWFSQSVAAWEDRKKFITFRVRVAVKIICLMRADGKKKAEGLWAYVLPLGWLGHKNLP